jgi:hypothetical protein
MDLLKRLRKVEPDGEGERTRWYRNPDGPEAADEIERLREALKEAVYLLNPTEEDMEKKAGVYRVVTALQQKDSE